MYWILLVMGALAAVVIALVVGGLATPRAHVVSRCVTVAASTDLVWRTIRDVGRYAEWRRELRESVASNGDDGPEWRESSGGGSQRFGIVVDEAPVRLTARILDDDAPFTGEWSWAVAPEGAGTRVTLTERGEVGNPLFRFIAAHMYGYDRTIDRYLRALAVRVGDPAAPIGHAVPVAARTAATAPAVR